MPVRWRGPSGWNPSPSRITKTLNRSYAGSSVPVSRHFVGSCCEPFYGKHRPDFERIGLPGILVDVERSTCYDLGQEKEGLSRVNSKTRPISTFPSFKGFWSIPMVETTLSEAYDIVIVGAGPAGSSAARAAAQEGAKVLLIDRRQRIGVPVQCAELVTQWIFRYAHFSSHCIVQTIETMVTHLPDRIFHDKRYEMKSPGYMLDRSLFDKELATSAVLAGAKLSTETKAIGLIPEGLHGRTGDQEERTFRRRSLSEQTESIPS